MLDVSFRPKLLCPILASVITLLVLVNVPTGHSVSLIVPETPLNNSIFLLNVKSNKMEEKYIMHALRKTEITPHDIYMYQRTIMTCPFNPFARFELVAKLMKTLKLDSKELHIKTSDMEVRYLWLKQFEMMEPGIAASTKGRLRIVGRDFTIKSAIRTDQAIYTCFVIDKHGIHMHHFNLTVKVFERTWFDFNNPNAVLKCTLLSSFIIFALVLLRNFIMHGKDQTQQLYDTMVIDPELLFKNLKRLVLKSKEEDE